MDAILNCNSAVESRVLNLSKWILMKFSFDLSDDRGNVFIYLFKFFFTFITYKR